MRTLTVLAAVLAVATFAAAAAPRPRGCTAPPPPQLNPHHQQASSFAPRPKPANNAYGQPIQPTILHHRVKAKKPASGAVSVPAQDLPAPAPKT
jgi:hypothetical protein